MQNAEQFGVGAHFGGFVYMAHRAEHAGAQRHLAHALDQQAARHRLRQRYLVELLEPVAQRELVPLVGAGGQHVERKFVFRRPGVAQPGGPVRNQGVGVALQLGTVGQHQPGLVGDAAYRIGLAALVQLLHGDGGALVATAADGPSDTVILHVVATLYQIDQQRHGGAQAAHAHAPDGAVALLLAQLFPGGGRKAGQHHIVAGIAWAGGDMDRLHLRFGSGDCGHGQRIDKALRMALGHSLLEQRFGHR